MQIKKTTRDAQFPGAPRYDTANAYNIESRDERDTSVPEQFAVRHTRSADGSSSGDSPEATQTARTTSVIDRHSSFDGQFETEQDMRVEGTISGEVICRGLFTVDREATARVRVQAQDAHIHGRLEGDIVCTGKLTLASNSHVTGTMKAAVLVVEEGATVSGSVDTTQNAATPRSVATPSKNGEREPAGVKSARRDLPSFAIVTSDERAASDN